MDTIEKTAGVKKELIEIGDSDTDLEQVAKKTGVKRKVIVISSRFRI